MMKMIYIFWSCRDAGEAKQIIYKLLDQRLIACASFLPEVTSIYRWEGSIEETKEVKIILKTKQEYFEPICQSILESGTYEIPEIVALDTLQVNQSYLSWLLEETKKVPS